MQPSSLKFHRPYTPSKVKGGDEEKLPITGCIAGTSITLQIQIHLQLSLQPLAD